VPSQDVVLGLYYMTRERINAKGEGMMFANTDELRRAWQMGLVEISKLINASSASAV
jgi:DNA-directed RNA polymerase subunit beta'